MSNLTKALLCLLVSIPSGHAQSGLTATFTSDGLSALSYNGFNFLNQGRFVVNSVQLQTPGGVTLAGSLNASQTFDSSAKQLTQTYNWGKVTVLYTTVNNNLNLTITTSNTGSNTIRQLSFEPMDVILPANPVEYDGVTPILATNIGAPTALSLTAGPTVLVLTNPDVTPPLLTGFPWALDRPASQKLFPVYAYTGSNPMLPDSLPFINRPIAPGSSDTWRLSLRFAAAGTPLKTLVSDVYSAFASAFPPTLKWTDRRSIGSLIIGTAAAGWAKNPRGWFLDPYLDVTTPKGIQAFQDRLLAWADSAVTILKSMNSQGMITWDIEGEQFPHATTYIGDPTLVSTLAPEMSGVVDAYFKKFTDAGLRVGVCIRPQQLVLAAGNVSAVQQDVPDPTSLLIGKINYAKNRWGATLFYVDSNGLPSTPTDVSVFQRVAAAVPGVLLIPEHQNTAYYGVTAPYDQLNQGIISTPQQVRDIYPESFTVINTADGPIQQNQAALTASVRAGDSLMYRSWFADLPANNLVQQIYAAAGVTPPPAVSISTPANNSVVSGTISVTAAASSPAGISKVQFSLDGASFGPALTGAPYTASVNTTLTGDGTHTITATAYDTAGRTAAGSVTVTFRNTDTVPPVVSITSPQNNSTVSGQITAIATASDNVGVASVQFSIDGAVSGAALISPPYTLALNTVNLPNGTHTISATARDAAGNAGSAGVVVSVNNPVVDTIPPTVAITSPAPNSIVAGSLILAANATDNIAVKSLQFMADNVPFGAIQTSPPFSVVVNTLSLSNGAHLLGAKAQDAAGNIGSANIPVTVNNPDLTPPAITLTSPANNSTISGSILLAASATDNLAVAGVQFFLDNTPVGPEVTAPPYTTLLNTATWPNGAHNISARARDVAGNTATATAAVQVANGIPDTTLPNISITYPGNNTEISGLVTLTCTATDNVGVVRVQWYDYGTPINTPVTAAPFSTVWNTAAANGGSHQLTAVAWDAAGNSSYSQIQVGVSHIISLLPQVSLDAPSNGSTVSGVITLSASSTGAGFVQFSFDGVAAGPALASPPYTAVFDTTKVPNGTHSVTALATNSAGNASSTVSVNVVNVVSDVTPPVVSFVFPTPGAVLTGSVTLAANASDNVGVASVAFTIDGAPVGTPLTTAPYSIVFGTTKFLNGPHTIRAVAADAAGNTAAANVTIQINNPAIDNIPPTVSLVSPLNNSTVTGVVAVTAQASDNVGVASVRLLLDGNLIGNVPTPPYTVNLNTSQTANGLHTLSAIAADAAGNVARADATITVANAVADTTPPTLSGITPQNNSTVTGSILLSATATDNQAVASVTFTIDGVTAGVATSAPYAIALESATLWGGVHYLTVTARDLAGNSAFGTISFTSYNNSGPSAGQNGIGVWVASYYPAANFSGVPLNRLDQAIGFDWNVASPAPSVPADTFSAIWRGLFNFDGSANYRFDLQLTGGGRLYIDDRLVLDKWNQPDIYVSFSTVQALTGGTHMIRAEYQKTGSTALARVNWTKQ